VAFSINTIALFTTLYAAVVLLRFA